VLYLAKDFYALLFQSGDMTFNIFDKGNMEALLSVLLAGLAVETSIFSYAIEEAVYLTIRHTGKSCTHHNYNKANHLH